MIRNYRLGLLAALAGLACGEKASPPVGNDGGSTADGSGQINATSSIATNLHGIAYWSPEWTFVDAFKASSPWISGSTSGSWNDGRIVDTDTDGWVKSLQADQIARTLMFVIQGGHYPAGPYIVRYDGQGTLQYGQGATLAQSGPGRDVLQVDPIRGPIELDVTSTAAGDPIRNIHVIMPGGICHGDPFRYAADSAACSGLGAFESFEDNYATIVFHPKFLERLRPYRALRFQEWAATNNSTQQFWSGRSKLSDARWWEYPPLNAKGVPVEVMVDLANRLGADPWFNLPHLADDAYVTEYARLVAQNLRPDLKAYVEYSNEVWNGIFAQAAYAQAQGLALGLSTNPGLAQLFFYSKRSVEIFAVWSAEMGNPARLVRVMATQAAATQASQYVLDYDNASLKTDVLAIAPYFGNRLGMPSQETTTAAMTLSDLFSALQTSELPLAVGMINDQMAVAKAHGLPLVAYEAGQHLVGVGSAQNNLAINALFDSANRDPRMGDVYTSYLNAWKASGAQLLFHFTSCGVYDKYGRFGALEYLEQPRADAPKLDAIQTFMEQNPQWW